MTVIIKQLIVSFMNSRLCTILDNISIFHFCTLLNYFFRNERNLLFPCANCQICTSKLMHTSKSLRINFYRFISNTQQSCTPSFSRIWYVPTREHPIWINNPHYVCQDYSDVQHHKSFRYVGFRYRSSEQIIK